MALVDELSEVALLLLDGQRRAAARVLVPHLRSRNVDAVTALGTTLAWLPDSPIDRGARILRWAVRRRSALAAWNLSTALSVRGRRAEADRYRTIAIDLGFPMAAR